MEEIFSLSSYAFQWWVLPQTVFAVLILALGVFAYSQNTRAPVNRSFLYLTLAEALWLAGFGLAYLSSNATAALFWFRLGYIGVLFIPAMAYRFSVRYTGADWQRAATRAAVGASIGFALLTPALSSGLYRYSWGSYIRLTQTNVPFMLLFGLLAVLFVANLWGRFRQAPTERERKIHGTLLAVTALAYLGAIDFLPAYGIWLPLPPLGFLPNAVFVCAMGYLLLRHRLLEIRTLVHQTLGYLTFTALVALLYGSVFAAIQALTHRDTDGQELLGSFLLFVTLLYLFAPLKESTKRLVERIFNRELVNVRERVNRFVGRLQHITSLPQLQRDLLQLMVRDVGAASCVLLTPEPGGGAYVVSGNRGQKLAPRDRTFPTVRFEPWFTHLLTQGSLITREQLQADPAHEPVRALGLEFFDRLGAELVIPLQSQGKLVAGLTLGPKRHGGYSTEDARLLSVISGTLAVGLQNSILVEHLKAVGELKSNFVTIATHQLRTPLSEIKWAINTLREDSAPQLTDRQRELLDHANATNERMIKLTNMLQELTRFERGALAANRHPLDLRRLAAEVVADQQALADRHRVRVTVQASRLPAVNAEREKIKPVIATLVDNAIRYNRPGGRVTLRIEAESERVTFSVSDTGIGIPAADRSKIFSAFFRSANAITADTEGIGLGLYHARQMLEAHGSALYFRSHPSGGTTFSFSLPRTPEK